MIKFINFLAKGHSTDQKKCMRGEDYNLIISIGILSWLPARENLTSAYYLRREILALLPARPPDGGEHVANFNLFLPIGDHKNILFQLIADRGKSRQVYQFGAHRVRAAASGKAALLQHALDPDVYLG